MNNGDYSENYSDEGFWKKVLGHMKSAGRQVINVALTLYYCGIDPKTSPVTKGIIFAPLGYFISPVDAIPDFTPIIGYADDLGVLLFALSTVSTSVKPEHNQAAKEKTDAWFGPEEQIES